MHPIDSNDEEVHVVTVVPELEYQLRNDISICVILGIIKANGVNEA